MSCLLLLRKVRFLCLKHHEGAWDECLRFAGVLGLGFMPDHEPARLFLVTVGMGVGSIFGSFIGMDVISRLIRYCQRALVCPKL